MLNFSSFASFGKLNSAIALEAMNNADQRMLSQRSLRKTAVDPIMIQMDLKKEVQLQEEARLYADIWIKVSNFESEGEWDDVQPIVEGERQYGRYADGCDDPDIRNWESL